MQHGAREFIRAAVVTALSTLLLVVCVYGVARLPAPAATWEPDAHQSAEHVESGLSSAETVLGSRSQQPHRVDPPTQALLRVFVGMACPSETTACQAAEDQPLGIFRVTPDGRAPPA